ncbi:Fur-regulated basic protein FbpA [Halalkalibacter oceani]|uniref:Fur-regulated basic protein FbpA n=1 Tax=Halalkalibacter oceani TaxID=1653776 RepID=UPI0033988C98
MDQVTNLRRLDEQQKESIIGQLISAGIYKLVDGRDLYEATLSELESEMRYINSQREGDVLS